MQQHATPAPPTSAFMGVELIRPLPAPMVDVRQCIVEAIQMAGGEVFRHAYRGTGPVIEFAINGTLVRVTEQSDPDEVYEAYRQAVIAQTENPVDDFSVLVIPNSDPAATPAAVA